MRLAQFDPRLKSSLPKRIGKKITRDFIHATCPRLYFRKLLKLQKIHFDKPTYTFSFDLDFYEDYAQCPSLLEQLKNANIKACFAVIGKFVEEFPAIHKRMIFEGHEIINHTYTHPDNPHWAPNLFFNELTIEEQTNEIEQCHEAVLKHTDFSMVGYRSPHFGNLHTDTIYPIIKNLGYKYSSSVSLQYSKSNGEPYVHKKGIIEFPLSGSLNYPLAVFDNWNAQRKRNPFFSTDEQFNTEFNESIKEFSKSNGYATHYFDPYDLSNDKLRKMIGALKSNDIELKTYKEIVEDTKFRV